MSKHASICGYGHQNRLRKIGGPEKHISILVANWHGGEAIELCIESILKRTTKGVRYKIYVLDSTGEGSREREYLKKQRDIGNIRLVTKEVRMEHGEALKVLLKECNSLLACFLDSDIEVLHKDWLLDLIKLVQTPKDLGVAKFEPAGAAFNQRGEWEWIAPTFRPFCMLLNLRLYNNIAQKNDWDWGVCKVEDYPCPKLFKNFRPPDKGIVFLHMAFFFSEKIIFFNKHNLRMHDTPPGFWETKIRHYESLSHPEDDINGEEGQRHKRKLIHEALLRLRAEKRKDE